MKNINTNPIGRRTVLMGASVALAGLGGLSGSVAAKGKGGKNNLADTPAGFTLYWSGVDDERTDPNKPGDYGFPLTSKPSKPINLANAAPGATGDWFLVGQDPGDGEGLFDGSNIEITPNHRTLHHDLNVFAGFLMKGKAKPYTLVNQGDGVFESRGQTVNFQARTAAEMVPLLTQAFVDQGVDQQQAAELAGFLVTSEPLRSLVGGKWRAVATERLAVDLKGESLDSDWAATRVDIYSRGGGKSEFELSLLFTLWGLHDPSRIEENALAANSFAGSLISRGRLNHGGQ